MIPIVYILSLEDAVERRAPLIAQFDNREIPYQIWQAIDGRNGLPPEYESMIDRDKARQNLKRKMGNAEFACALSHHFIYRDILDRGLEMAVVLEDDAIVDDRFFDFLKVLQKPACDLLLLDHRRALVQRTGKLKLSLATSAYRCISNPWLTTGYLVTCEGAQKLVDRSLPIAWPADWPTDLAQMQAYAITPRVVDHPPGDTGHSDIRSDRKGLVQAKPHRKRRSAKRFLQLSYWNKTYRKRLGKWVS